MGKDRKECRNRVRIAERKLKYRLKRNARRVAKENPKLYQLSNYIGEMQKNLTDQKDSEVKRIMLEKVCAAVHQEYQMCIDSSMICHALEKITDSTQDICNLNYKIINIIDSDERLQLALKSRFAMFFVKKVLLDLQLGDYVGVEQEFFELVLSFLNSNKLNKLVNPNNCEWFFVLVQYILQFLSGLMCPLLCMGLVDRHSKALKHLYYNTVYNRHCEFNCVVIVNKQHYLKHILKKAYVPVSNTENSVFFVIATDNEEACRQRKRGYLTSIYEAFIDSYDIMALSERSMNCAVMVLLINRFVYKSKYNATTFNLVFDKINLSQKGFIDFCTDNRLSILVQGVINCCESTHLKKLLKNFKKSFKKLIQNKYGVHVVCAYLYMYRIMNVQDEGDLLEFLKDSVLDGSEENYRLRTAVFDFFCFFGDEPQEDEENEENLIEMPGISHKELFDLQAPIERQIQVANYAARLILFQKDMKLARRFFRFLNKFLLEQKYCRPVCEKMINSPGVSIMLNFFVNNDLCLLDVNHVISSNILLFSSSRLHSGLIIHMDETSRQNSGIRLALGELNYSGLNKHAKLVYKKLFH